MVGTPGRGPRRGATLGALALLGALGVTAGCGRSYARRPHYQQPQLDVGVAHASATVGFDGASAASGYALHLVEANGIITKTLLLGWLSLGEEVSDRARRTSTSSAYATETRAVGVRCRDAATATDCTASAYQTFTKRQVEVRMRPRTPDEQAAYDAAATATGGLLDMLPMHTDITYFPRRDDGGLWGYSVLSYPVAVPVTSYLEIAAGYYWQRLSARVTDMATSDEVTRTHRGSGVPVRLTLQPVSWASVQGELLLNRRAFGDDRDATHGARISGALALPWMQRAFARVGVERNRLGEAGGWGTTLELGARF